MAKSTKKWDKKFKLGKKQTNRKEIIIPSLEAFPYKSFHTFEITI